MAQSLFEQLTAMTVAVVDTGDINSIKKLTPRDATTNPSLITAAAQMPEYADVVDSVLRRAEHHAGREAEIAAAAVDQLSVDFGLRILAIVPGRVSTEVDARLSFDTAKTMDKAHHLIALYQAAGVSRDRVLIKIASTWEGIRAAEVLEKEGIHCNLTLLFGMHQAIACAEAGVTLISPFVGRILDWYKKKQNRDFAPTEDPGVLSVTRIYNYLKKYEYKTEVMGASFRSLDEIIELAGCDLLTIAPNYMLELAEKEGTLVRKLDPEKARAMDIPKTSLDEASFRVAHEADEMARDKLAEGITGFSKAIVALEKLLGERYRALQGKARAGQAAHDFFCAFDLDGDGLITREEWGGSLAVFLALDQDGDGKITPQEMAAGLGGAFVLAK
ncbi:MAG TPA: transaldolase [Kofleriaceae bacterium]|nr:transaldolase [Kofleriaceae bacterium]